MPAAQDTTEYKGYGMFVGRMFQNIQLEQIQTLNERYQELGYVLSSSGQSFLASQKKRRIDKV